MEEPCAGVDVDAVRIKGGQDYSNKDDDKNHLFDPTAKDASKNISFSFNHDVLKSNEPSAKKIKTSHINETSPKTKG